MKTKLLIILNLGLAINAHAGRVNGRLDAGTSWGTSSNWFPKHRS